MSISSKIARLFLACIGALLIAQSVAAATEIPVVKPGARVRVKSREPSGDTVRTRQVSGVLHEISEASITVENPLTGAIVIFPRESISKFEVSIAGGQRGSGALMGFGIGAAVGALVGFVVPPSEEDYIDDPAEAAGILAGIFGATGALIGAIWAPGEQWEQVPIGPASLGIDYNKKRGGGVFLSMSF